MALAISFDDAKIRQYRHEGDGKGSTGGTTTTPFFGAHHMRGHWSAAPVEHGSDTPNLPDARLEHFDAGKFSSPHFHVSDQFQVVIDGKGKLGRHALTPYCVHFSRAYTPYGPLLADDRSGLAMLVLRARADPGSQRLPQERQQLMSVSNREPWQITRAIGSFPAPSSSAAEKGVRWQAVTDMHDASGLSAYALSMNANTRAHAPDPALGEGQYLIVVRGSLLHDNQEHKALALVFVFPGEQPFALHAGCNGLEAIVLNFPAVITRPPPAP